MLLMTGLLGFFILGFYAAGHFLTPGKSQTFTLEEADFASLYTGHGSGPRLAHVTTESIPLQDKGIATFYVTGPNEILSLPKWGGMPIAVSSYNLQNKQMNHRELKVPSKSVFYSEGYFIWIDSGSAYMQNSTDQDDYKQLSQGLYFKERLRLLMDSGVPIADLQEERVTDVFYDRDAESLYLSAQYDDQTAGFFQYQIGTRTLKLLTATTYIDSFQVLPSHNVLFLNHGGLFLLDVNTGSTQQLVEGKVINFSVSADGLRLVYTAVNERGVTELYGMYMDRSIAKEVREHAALLYSNLSNVQALEWSNDRVLCITRQANGSYQLYRFTLKSE